MEKKSECTYRIPGFENAVSSQAESLDRLLERNPWTTHCPRDARTRKRLGVKTLETRWLLETVSDSDWAGSKSHRRSTSSAMHVVNGVVVVTSSRGRKSVSLSSAEADALTSAAADGIYVKRCLEFLAEEIVEHDCLVDNSAAVHVSHKRGPGNYAISMGSFCGFRTS